MPIYERLFAFPESVRALSLFYTHAHTQVPMQVHLSLRAGPCPEGWPLSQFSPRLWGWSPDLPPSFLPFLIALKPPPHVPIIVLPG